VPILLATNVAARGLDVTHVTQVINVELPESPQLLTHRIGRTGRMGRQGQAITLLGLEDGAKWRQLERGLGRRIPRATWKGAKSALSETAVADLASTGTAPTPERVERVTRERPVAPRSPQGPAKGPRRARTAPRPVEIDVMRDAAVESSPNLLSAYGRDPRRPSWANGNGSGDVREPRRRPVRSPGRHRIDCAACGQPAEVPFKPDPARPVYCASCFQERRQATRRPEAVLASS
jgi:CxxC-x17-CxxC domain-containing protein